MRAEDILKYIQEPHLLTKESIPELQKLVNDFPYFQSGHLLLSLASRRWDTSVYQQSLKKTAIVATNRSHLYKLIHEPLKEDTLVSEEKDSTASENIQKELNILKSAEITVEALEEQDTVNLQEKEIAVQDTRKDEEQQDSIVNPSEKTEETSKKLKTESDLQEEKKEEEHAVRKKIADADTETVIALEIEKALVNSFVEKEVLKTNEIHHKEILKTDKPESFGDWLKFLKKNNGQSYTQIEEEVNKGKIKDAQKAKEKEKEQQSVKEKKKAIIDKIIEVNPGVIRQKEDQKFFKSDLKAKESLLESEHLVTETLARIYALQGNINKAIRAYEILSLKYPQKSAYFATLIQKLKSNQ